MVYHERDFLHGERRLGFRSLGHRHPSLQRGRHLYLHIELRRQRRILRSQIGHDRRDQSAGLGHGHELRRDPCVVPDRRFGSAHLDQQRRQLLHPERWRGWLGSVDGRHLEHRYQHRRDQHRRQLYIHPDLRLGRRKRPRQLRDHQCHQRPTACGEHLHLHGITGFDRGGSIDRVRLVVGEREVLHCKRRHRTSAGTDLSVVGDLKENHKRIDRYFCDLSLEVTFP
jgi:hypothetical protein